VIALAMFDDDDEYDDMPPLVSDSDNEDMPQLVIDDEYDDMYTPVGDSEDDNSSQTDTEPIAP
jgi:hypothetical protein